MSILKRTAQLMLITCLAGASLQPIVFAMQPTNAERHQLDLNLIEAVRNGDVNAVITRLQDGADVHHPVFTDDDGDTYTLLHLAASEGHTEVVNILLENGANIHATRFGYNSLHEAAHHGHLEVVNTLLKHGANLNTVTYAEETPLHLAAEHGHLEVVKALLKHGAHVQPRNDVGETPLDLAGRWWGRHADIVTVLERERDFPLHSAAALGHTERVRNMLRNGADINQLDHEGRAPIELAANRKIRSMLRSRAAPQMSSLMKILPHDVVRTTAEMMGPGSVDAFHHLSTGYVRKSRRLGAR